jgi:hypothetical protein
LTLEIVLKIVTLQHENIKKNGSVYHIIWSGSSLTAYRCEDGRFLLVLNINHHSLSRSKIGFNPSWNKKLKKASD